MTEHFTRDEPTTNDTEFDNNTAFGNDDVQNHTSTDKKPQPHDHDLTHIQRPRYVNTFMKRRTHMNKQAQKALTDDAYQLYLANVTPNDSSGEAVNNGKLVKNSSEADISHITNLRDLFADTSLTPNGVDAPLTLEIGFGMGGSLIEMAIKDPKRNFVGIEVHEPGIGKCAYLAKQNHLNNIKIINGDAIQLLQQLPEAHIDRVQLYFPDPWQKKRHYKRRFVSPERMAIVTRSLKAGGWFHTATDWEHYAFWMLDVLDNFEGLTNLAGMGNFMARPDFRPLTKFEKRGIDSGHGVWDLIYRKD